MIAKKIRPQKIIMLLAILIVSSLIINGCTTSSTNHEINNVNDHQANETVFVETGIMSEIPQSFDDLVGSVNLIVLGKVTDSVELGNGGDLFKVRIEEVYKNASQIKVKDINVYQGSETFKKDSYYILFLRESNLPYFPPHTYRQIEHRHIVGVQEDRLYHRSPFIEQGTTLTKLEELIYSSDKLDQKNPFLYQFPTIPSKSLKLDNMIEQAHLIAHVEVTKSEFNTIYTHHTLFTFKDIYKQSHTSFTIEELNKSPYIMPAALNVGEEYMLFAQYADGMFVTLSTKGSLISKDETKKWNRAIKKLIN